MNEPASISPPGRAELFLAFLGISAIGFGGVLPWARWMMVERRNWVTSKEFAEMLSLCKFLPGGNICNLAVIVGHRFHGLSGAVAAFVGLMAAPFVIVLILASLFARYGSMPGVENALTAVGASATGLVVTMALKMVWDLREDSLMFAPAIAAFVTVGLFRVPIIVAVLVLAPLSVLLAWRRVK